MPATEEATVSKGRAILTVGLCCLVAIMEGIDLQAPGLTLPILGPLFHMSPGDKGLFLSMSTFGLMIGAAIGGPLSDLIGRKWILIVSAALFGAFTVLTAMSTSAHMLMALRFLTGLGMGGALPNVIALAAESVSPARRRSAVGFLYAGMPGGGGVASLVAAFASKPEQWPVVYLVGGVAPLVLVPLLVFLLPKAAPAARSAEPGARLDVINALFGEGRATRTLLLWTGFFFSLLITYLLLGWLPSLMGGRGLSRPQASTVQVAWSWVGVLGGVGAGLLLDRSRGWRMVALLFVAAGLALIFLALAPGQFSLMLLASALAGATLAGTQAALYGLAPACYPTRVRGAGVGFAVAMGRFGSAMGPMLAGVMVGAGWRTEQLLLALTPILVISALGAVMVARMAGAGPAEAWIGLGDAYS